LKMVLEIKKSELIGAFAPSTGALVAEELIRVKLKEAGLEDKEVYTRAETVRLCSELMHKDGVIKTNAQTLARANAELRESEEKYRLLVENANEAVLVVQDGLFKFFNCKTMEISCYSQEELASKPFAELIHPEDREMVVERHRRRLKGEKFLNVYPFRIIDKDGNVKWVEINAVLINWEGRPATLNFLTDITERKRAEEALEHRILALTQPSGELRNLALTDIIDVSLLQELQDEFALCHDVASLMFTPTGEPITKPSNFSEFCLLLRSTQKGLENCMRSDAVLGEKVAKGVPAMNPCQNFKQIMDGAVPIIIGGQHIANWGIGQVLTAPLDAEEVSRYAREIRADKDELVSASRKLKIMPGAKFVQLVDFMAIIADDLSLLGLQNLQQARDIAEQKRMEEELRKERDRARKYLDVAGVMLVVIDAEERVKLINRKGCKILGYKEEEIIDKNWFDTFIPAENRDEVKAVFKQLMAGEIQNVEYFENPIVRKNGEERIIAWQDTILRDNDGRIIASLSSGEDITERKRAEQKLQQYLTRLEQFNHLAVDREMRMIELKREVNEAYERLGEKPPYDLSFADGGKITNYEWEIGTRGEEKNGKW